MKPSPLEKKPFSLIIATITAAMLFFAAFRCPVTDQHGPSVSAPRPTATRPADPHDWPEWRAFRYREAKLKTGCQWLGCPKDHTTKDLELHHGISAEWCLKSDHPELIYTKGKGQWFCGFAEITMLSRTTSAMAVAELGLSSIQTHRLMLLPVNGIPEANQSGRSRLRMKSFAG